MGEGATKIYTNPVRFYFFCRPPPPQPFLRSLCFQFSVHVSCAFKVFRLFAFNFERVFGEHKPLFPFFYSVLCASQKIYCYFLIAESFVTYSRVFFACNVGYSFHPEMWGVVVAILLILLWYYNNITLQTRNIRLHATWRGSVGFGII